MHLKMRKAAIAVAAVVLPLIGLTGWSSPARAAGDRFFTDVTWNAWSTFYPTVKDDFRDTAELDFDTTDKMDGYTWAITNSAGTKVRTGSEGDTNPDDIVQPEDAFDYGVIEWNGRNNAGVMQAPGVYMLTITAQQNWYMTTEGQNLTHTLVRNLTIATDTVVKHWHDRWVPGDTGSTYWDSRTATGRCQVRRGYRSAVLDCWGKGHATVSYSFWLPTTGEEPGAGRVRNLKIWFNGTVGCCKPGKVIKKITHPRTHIWRGTVTVTNWRAYTVNSFNASYEYTKRR